MVKSKQSIASAVLKPHKMGLVFRQIADTYSTIQQMTQELVQNSIDVDATNVEVIINAQSNYIVVHDNGSGASVAEFNEALESVLKSGKGKDKFGRFGRGNISPLTKCREFTFTSRGRTGPFHRWTFHCKEILESDGFPRITPEDIGRGGSGQWWRTEVMLKGVKFSDDAVKYAVHLDELKDTILSRFATKMRRLGTVIKVSYMNGTGKFAEKVFSAQSYEGTPLSVWHHNDDTPAGKVSVKLFLAKEGSSPIPVTLGQTGDPFRIDWKTFYNSVTAFAVKNKRVVFSGKDINDLFRSGMITGEIECENIVIHPDREKFERDEALDWFVVILEAWYEQVGKTIYTNAQIQARSSLYQQVAIEASKRIEKHPLVDRFLEIVKFGSIGHGHATVDTKAIGQITSAEVSRGHDKGKGTHAPEGMTVNEPEDKVTRPKHVPITVDGPEGSKRTIVRGESKGLRIAIDPFPGLGGVEAPLFSTNVEQGLVTINQLSPSFNACADRGERSLRRYIDMVVLAALQSAVATDPTKTQVDLEQYVRYANDAFLNGDQRGL